MTWTKLPDSFGDQTLGLSDSAFRTHVVATIYANEHGLDGVLPKDRVPLLPVPPKSKRPSVIRELVEAGRWSDDGERWILIDFFTGGQLSAEEIALQRRWNVIRQELVFAKGNDLKRVELRTLEDDVKAQLHAARGRRKVLASPVTSLVSSRVPVSDPSRPVPSQDEDEDERRDGSSTTLRVVDPSLESECPYCEHPVPPSKCIAARFDGRVREWHVECLDHYLRDFPEVEAEHRVDPDVPLTVGERMAAIFKDAS